MIVQFAVRFSSQIKATIEIDAKWESRTIRDQRGEAIRIALKSGIALSGSDLSDSNLRDSDLSGSNLRDSNLRDSDLSGSNLRDSDLRDSDLRGCNLSGSNLRDSNLRGCNLSGVPAIKNIHQAVYQAASQPNALDMNHWHSCETTHCRAGWVITLAGAAGAAMEYCIGTASAAALIYLKSDPKMEKIPNFYAANEDALNDMRRLAEQEMQP